MGKRHLTAEQRALILRLRARGLTLKEIGAQLDCTLQTASEVINRAPIRPVRQDRWEPGPGRLTLAEREEISLALRRHAT